MPRWRRRSSSASRLAGDAERVQPRVPERLVDVDVPEPGDGALVEQRGLERGSPAGEPLAERLRGEPAERLLPHLRGQVRLELAGLEQQPRAEAAHVAVDDPGAVVERDERAPVRMTSGAGSCSTVPVMRRWTSSARPDSNRTIRYLPRRSTSTHPLAASSDARPRAARAGGVEPGVVDLDVARTSRPSSTGRSRRADVSTSGSSGTAITLAADRAWPAMPTARRDTASTG